VKAIAIAAANGQKVYTLNQSNQAYHQGIVAGLGTDADTKAEIANALNAGMEVTVHQADITAHGWTGMGYILLDPETGAGAYKISGGANGAIVLIAIVLMALALAALSAEIIIFEVALSLMIFSIGSMILKTAVAHRIGGRQEG
jgi:hypothetical protein